MKNTILLAVALFFVSVIAIGFFSGSDSPKENAAPLVLPQKSARTVTGKPEKSDASELNSPTNASEVQREVVTYTSIMPQQPPDAGKTAYFLGRKVCQAMLKAPGSAKFSNYYNDPNTGYAHYGYFQWQVFGWVEAQNSFGARLRQKWVAVVQMNAGAYEVVYFNLNGDETGKDPGMRKAPEFFNHESNRIRKVLTKE